MRSLKQKRLIAVLSCRWHLMSLVLMFHFRCRHPGCHLPEQKDLQDFAVWLDPVGL